MLENNGILNNYSLSEKELSTIFEDEFHYFEIRPGFIKISP